MSFIEQLTPADKAAPVIVLVVRPSRGQPVTERDRSWMRTLGVSVDEVHAYFKVRALYEKRKKVTMDALRGHDTPDSPSGRQRAA